MLDSGDGVSHAVPVYEGFAMPSSIRRIDVAGRDVTEHLQLLLRKSGYVFHTSAEKEVVRMIKEKTSYVALDPKKEEKEWSANAGRVESKAVDYILPDGNKLKVCQLKSASFRGLTALHRLDLNASELQKFSLIPKSLDLNTLESTKSWWTRSIGRIWTFESHYLVILCFQEVRHSRKASAIGFYMKYRDSLSRTCESKYSHHRNGSIVRGLVVVYWPDLALSGRSVILLVCNMYTANKSRPDVGEL